METTPKANSNKSLSYTSYLKVNELISLQNPLASPPAHDEMLFIVIHQVYELWFKLMVHELDAFISNLGTDNLPLCFRSLDRVCEIMRVLIQQIDVLETMTPIDFNKFRSHLNPASGFQSFQFREFELLAGADIKNYEKLLEFEPEWKVRLQNRGKNTNLKQAFAQFLTRKGLLKDNSNGSLLKTLQEIYQSPQHIEIQNLCERLIHLDEQVLLWRFRHVQMVERMIGMKRGTGGSLGVPYLQSTLKTRFFPELWEVRTAMGASY